MATDQLPIEPSGLLHRDDGYYTWTKGREPERRPGETYRMPFFTEADVRAAIAADRARAVPVAWREAFEAAMRDAWECADPLHPPGQPGSYARGSWQGMQDGLATLRNNFELRLREAARPPAPEQPADLSGQAATAAGEREAFEAWAAANGFNTHRDESDKYSDYHRATTRFAWRAWQARASISTPASGEGWKRVPVEPTEAMVDAGCDQHKCDPGDPWYSRHELSEGDCREIWSAMLAAAPTSPTEPAAEGGAA